MRLFLENNSFKIMKQDSKYNGEVYRIDEECHAFHKQYESAEFLAYCAYNALLNNENSITVNLFHISEGKIRNVNIIFERFKGVSFHFESEIQNMTNERDFTLKIKCGDKIWINQMQILKEMYSTIAHELMHCNIFYTKYEKEEEYNDIPDYYQKIISYLETHKERSLFKDFLYSLYSTFYQEAQAIVSEVSAEMTPYNKENIMVKLKASNGYKIFQNNLNIVKKIKKSEEIQGNIKKQLEEIGVELNIQKMIKHIEEVSKKSIHNIINNVYYNLGK